MDGSPPKNCADVTPIFADWKRHIVTEMLDPIVAAAAYKREVRDRLQCTQRERKPGGRIERLVGAHQCDRNARRSSTILR
jgi:hypothetical protein